MENKINGLLMTLALLTVGFVTQSQAQRVTGMIVPKTEKQVVKLPSDAKLEVSKSGSITKTKIAFANGYRLTIDGKVDVDPGNKTIALEFSEIVKKIVVAVIGAVSGGNSGGSKTTVQNCTQSSSGTIVINGEMHGDVTINVQCNPPK